VAAVPNGLSLTPLRIIKEKLGERNWKNPSHEQTNLAESSKKGYGPKRAVLPTITMMMRKWMHHVKGKAIPVTDRGGP
jgi:hypothetical protein